MLSSQLNICHETAINNNCNNLSGGLAIAVPGEIRGMYQVWKEHGSLPWKDLVQPTINLTTKGYQVPQRMHEAAHIWRGHVEADPGLRYDLKFTLFIINRGRFIKLKLTFVRLIG